jgi:hypothetical protein
MFQSLCCCCCSREVCGAAAVVGLDVRRREADRSFGVGDRQTERFRLCSFSGHSYCCSTHPDVSHRAVRVEHVVVPVEGDRARVQRAPASISRQAGFAPAAVESTTTTALKAAAAAAAAREEERPKQTTSGTTRNKNNNNERTLSGASSLSACLPGMQM